MRRVWMSVLFLTVIFAMPGKAFAQADEIQVYNGGLAPRGVFNLTYTTTSRRRA